MKIAIINKEQHREIYGKIYSDGMYFNPVLDKDGNIIISEQEVNQLDNKQHEWVKDLPLIDKDSQLKELTKQEWLLEEKKQAEDKIKEIDDKLKPIKK